MLNLKDLTFSYQSAYWKDTFVGIRKNSHTNTFEFQLPKGFEEFPEQNYSLVKELFFNTYKTYKKFFDEKKSIATTQGLDGFSESNNGFSLESKDGQMVFYSKLNMLDSILDAYSELEILNVRSKLTQSNNVDYSKIHLYMHKAIYIDDETIFVNEMDINKKVIDLDSPTLIELFCFIYNEIKYALDEQVENRRVLALADAFRERFLSFNSSLFEEETFEETISVLKDVLDIIDRTTAYKDNDYWHFYNAVYDFLYGENQESDEDGNIWGISNFTVIWEELCFTEAKFRLTKNRLLFADRIGRTQTFNNFRSPFYFQINLHNDKRRLLRPDLVYTHFDESIDNSIYLHILKNTSVLLNKNPCQINFKIIDYKYIHEHTCTTQSLSDERALDIRKQLVYELALQTNFMGAQTYSEFWIPAFFTDELLDFDIVPNLNREFGSAKIEVVKRNFFKLQKFYINA